MENLGNRWQFNSALSAKIDLMLLKTNLQVVKIDWTFLRGRNNGF